MRGASEINRGSQLAIKRQIKQSELINWRTLAINAAGVGGMRNSVLNYIPMKQRHLFAQITIHVR